MKIEKLNICHGDDGGEGFGLSHAQNVCSSVMKTRNSDPMKFIPVQTSYDEYKYSFICNEN